MTSDMNWLLQASGGGSQVRSQLDSDDGLSEQTRLRVEEWILDPGNSGHNEDEPQPDVLSPAPDNIDDRAEKLPGYAKLDFDERLRHWRESAVLKFNSGQYDQAEAFLQMLLKLSEGVNFHKDETLELLGMVYCRLGRWDEAEKIAHAQFKGSDNVKALLIASYSRLHEWDRAGRLLSQQFHGRDETLEILGLEFCQQGVWDDVNKILGTSFEGRGKVVEILANALFKHGKWEEAQNVLRESEVVGKTGSDTMYSLAKTFYDRKDLKRAEHWCQQAAIRRKALVEEKYVLFYLCVDLLARIYTAQALSVAAHAYMDILPDGIQGMIL